MFPPPAKAGGFHTEDFDEVEKSSGNIFRDLEMPDPEEHLAKCRLVFIIDDIITKRQLRRSKAAKILGIRKSELSDLLDGLFRDFSMTALFSMLEKLNHEIEVVVHQRSADTLPTKPHISTSTRNLRRDPVTGT